MNKIQIQKMILLIKIKKYIKIKILNQKIFKNNIMK